MIEITLQKNLKARLIFSIQLQQMLLKRFLLHSNTYCDPVSTKNRAKKILDRPH